MTTQVTLNENTENLLQDLRQVQKRIKMREETGAKPSTDPGYFPDLQRRDMLAAEIGMNLLWDWEDLPWT